MKRHIWKGNPHTAFNHSEADGPRQIPDNLLYEQIKERIKVSVDPSIGQISTIAKLLQRIVSKN